jgi:hypothetical protein
MTVSQKYRMVKVGVIALSFSTLGEASAIGTEGNYISNPGFERADPAQQDLPNNWETDVANKTDLQPVVVRDHAVRRCGANAVRVRFVEAMNYAGVLQRVSALSLRGKDIQFSGFVRRSSVQSIVGIWMLVTDRKETKLAYINSYKQPVTGGNRWSRHVVTMRIPPEAVTIKLGAAIYEKDGVMWADDLRLSEIEATSGSAQSCKTGTK